MNDWYTEDRKAFNHIDDPEMVKLTGVYHDTLNHVHEILQKIGEKHGLMYDPHNRCFRGKGWKHAGHVPCTQELYNCLREAESVAMKEKR